MCNNAPINCKPYYPCTGKGWVIDFIWSWNSAPIASGEFEFFLHSWPFPSENSSYSSSMQFFDSILKTYSTYCTCVLRYYAMDQNPNIVPEDHWGIKMKSCPSRGELDWITGSNPLLSPLIPVWGVVGLIIDRCVSILCVLYYTKVEEDKFTQSREWKF